MKKFRRIILLFLLPAVLCPAGAPTYRLQYRICGGAISRLLLVFPLRIYYEAMAAVDLTARPLPDGSTRFSFAGLPTPAYVLRTLGFAGKTLALLSVDDHDSNGQSFAADLLAQWPKKAPEFAERVKTIKKFPYFLEAGGPESFVFERDASGSYKNGSVKLQPRYRHHPAKTGIYFNVFPTLGELLGLLNHRYAPGPAGGRFPAKWTGEELDFSPDLNRAAELMEKVVKSMVTIQQKFPFRLNFHVSPGPPGGIEICGEAFPDVPLWKGFMIREVFRKVRLRAEDRALLADEIWVGIRNGKGQGGYGHLQLKRIETTEEKQ